MLTCLQGTCVEAPDKTLAHASLTFRSVCRYRIEDLVEKGDFLDSAYLLLFGDLPNHSEKRSFEYELKHHTLVHEQLIQFYRGF